MNRITINGTTFITNGRQVVVNGGSVIVDGRVISGGLSGIVEVKWEGELASLRTGHAGRDCCWH